MKCVHSNYFQSTSVTILKVIWSSQELKKRYLEVSLTCKKFLADFESVYQRSEDALDGAEHAAQAEVNQHEEEHDGPEGRCWEVGHGLCEGNEGQACALDRLLGGEKIWLDMGDF